jgi:hypothetical protein
VPKAFGHHNEYDDHCHEQKATDEESGSVIAQGIGHF